VRSGDAKIAPAPAEIVAAARTGWSEALVVRKMAARLQIRRSASKGDR